LSERFDNILIFNINNSRLLAAALLVAHLGAAAVVLLLPLAGWLQLLLLLLVGASLYRSLRLYATRQALQAVHGVVLEGDGDWTLRLKNAQEQGPCRLRRQYVHPWLVIVRLHCRHTRFPLNVLIAADAVEHDVFRCLRARLTFRNWEE
jgi:hypothetical protein